jgi:hypothetical protein
MPDGLGAELSSSNTQESIKDLPHSKTDQAKHFLVSSYSQTSHKETWFCFVGIFTLDFGVFFDSTERNMQAIS